MSVSLIKKPTIEATAAAVEYLRTLFPVGSYAAYTVEYPKSDGATRWVSIFATRTDEDGSVWSMDVTRNAAAALGEPVTFRTASSDPTIKTAGIGMDMGADMVGRLSRVLHGDYYAVKSHRSI